MDGRPTRLAMFAAANVYAWIGPGTPGRTPAFSHIERSLDRCASSVALASARHGMAGLPPQNISVQAPGFDFYLDCDRALNLPRSIPLHFQIHQMMRLAGICLLAATLAGCGTIRGMTSEFLADYLPESAGGLPADAPPRPGSPRYKKYIQEETAKSTQVDRQAPAQDADNRR